MMSCSSIDRKSTRLNSSHPSISYAVFCLKKKSASSRGRNAMCGGGNRYVARHGNDATKGTKIEGSEGEYELDSGVGDQISFFFLMKRLPPRSKLFPSTTLFR